jgi:hypothetical protein
MNRFFKLFHYELHRFRWIYSALLLVTLLSQFIGLYLFVRNYINMADERMVRESLSRSGYAAKYGILDFTQFSSSSLWFMAPIALCVVTLLLYVFLIWYRDWVGKNMFIYRLLMLPTSRRNIYLAKASVILCLVVALIAFQLLVLSLQNMMFNMLVPSEFRGLTSVAEIVRGNPVLRILIPNTFLEFVIYYAAGVIGVVIVFTGILIERSYRLKGLIGGILYSITVAVIFLSPIIISETWLINYIYPVELLVIEAVTGITIFCVSLWISFFLLNKKVTV